MKFVAAQASNAITISACLMLMSSTAIAADRMPFKMFDTHAHLISDDTSKYPRATQATTPQNTTPGSSNAATTGPGGAPTPVVVPGSSPQTERLIAWQDALGVEGAAAVQRRGTYGYDNRYILDSADAHADRFVPVAVLDAQDAQTPALVRDLVKQHGLAGVRLTGGVAEDGSFPWLDSAAALKTWAVANEAGLVIDLMNVPPGKSPAIIAKYIQLAQQFPKVRMVLDHVAWPDNKGAPDYGIDALHQSLAKQKNIYFKFTTINIEQLQAAKISTADFLRRVVDVYGADHVMWGSDVGNSTGTYEQLVDDAVAASAKLTADEKRKVFHDTGRSVFIRGGKT